MKIFVAHNYYQQPGGEDSVFAAETKLLAERGHCVLRHTVHNDDVAKYSHLSLAKNTIWSSDSYLELRELFRRERPDVAHFHNTLPLLSPAVYYAAAHEGVPVVQSVHNYRLMCPVALFHRDGNICEECLGKSLPWPSVRHACYRDSRSATAAVAAMMTAHHWAGTWRSKVDRYIVLTEFSRMKHIEGGIPPEKISVKPNFVYDDPMPGNDRCGYALFVGRFSPEKGIRTILKAYEEYDLPPIKIVGDGDLSKDVKKAVANNSRIEWVGRVTMDEVNDYMKKADFLIFPSTWYEGMPRTIIESFATGTPVIASNIGAMSSMVQDRVTGLHFRPDDADDLASKIQWVRANPDKLVSMQGAAREEFEDKYTAEKNYNILMDIYSSVIYNKEDDTVNE